MAREEHEVGVAAERLAADGLQVGNPPEGGGVPRGGEQLVREAALDGGVAADLVARPGERDGRRLVAGDDDVVDFVTDLLVAHRGAVRVAAREHHPEDVVARLDLHLAAGDVLADEAHELVVEAAGLRPGAESAVLVTEPGEVEDGRGDRQALHDRVVEGREVHIFTDAEDGAGHDLQRDPLRELVQVEHRSFAEVTSAPQGDVREHVAVDGRARGVERRSEEAPRRLVRGPALEIEGVFAELLLDGLHAERRERVGVGGHDRADALRIARDNGPGGARECQEEGVSPPLDAPREEGVRIEDEARERHEEAGRAGGQSQGGARRQGSKRRNIVTLFE